MLTNKGGMICRHLSLSLAFSRFHFVCSLSCAALSAPSITRKKRKSIRLSMLDGGLKGITTTGRRSRNGHAKPHNGNSRGSRVRAGHGVVMNQTYTRNGGHTLQKGLF